MELVKTASMLTLLPTNTQKNAPTMYPIDYSNGYTCRENMYDSGVKLAPIG